MFLNRALTTIAVLLLSSLLAGAPIYASPAIVKDESGKVIPGNPRWPNGTTIHVFIPDDPRFDDIKAGVQRWPSLLTDRGLTIDVQKGPVPAGATNAVGVNFVDPSSLGNDSAGNKNIAETNPQGGTVLKNGQQTVGPLTGGIIDISKDASGSDFLRNLAQHEFGHALGLADEPTQQGQPHNVMDHNVDSTGTTAFTDKDKQELGSLYANAQLPTPTGTMLAQARGNTFLYTAEWENGSTIPFVQIGTNGAPVSDITADGFGVAGTSALSPNSAGWFLLDPTNPASLAGSVEDFSAIFNGQGGDYLTFINFLDPLGPDNPIAEFEFSSFTGIGTVLTFLTADNFVTTLGPAPIPEPSSFGPFCTGIITLLAAVNFPFGQRRTSASDRRPATSNVGISLPPSDVPGHHSTGEKGAGGLVDMARPPRGAMSASLQSRAPVDRRKRSLPRGIRFCALAHD